MLACAPHRAVCFPLLAAKPYFLSRAACELALPRVPAMDHPQCERTSCRLALKLTERPVLSAKRPAPIRP